jgi:hypothetical protein
MSRAALHAQELTFEVRYDVHMDGMQGPAEIAGLVRIGEPGPVPVETLACVAAEAGVTFPQPLVSLLSTWGPGVLCGIFTLEDPTDVAETSRFQRLQRRLRVEAMQARATGHWAQIPESDFARTMILGIDRRGAALALLADTSTRGELVVLHPRGYVLPIGDFDSLVRTFLLGTAVERTRSVILHDGANGNWSWAASKPKWAAAADLGVPAVYRVIAGGDADPLRGGAMACEPVLAALRRGSESDADEALGVALGQHVALYVLLELLAALVDDSGEDVPIELRVSYIEQLVRMTKRRAPCLASEVPLSALREALTAGEARSALALSLRENSVLEPFEGVFSLERDLATEAAHAATAVNPPAVPVELVPNAEARGFVAPPNFPPVSGEAQIACSNVLRAS